MGKKTNTINSNKKQMKYDLETVLFTKKDIKEKVVEVGKRISEDYKERNPILLGLLKGSFVFLSDLAREITIDLTVEVKTLNFYI